MSAFDDLLEPQHDYVEALEKALDIADDIDSEEENDEDNV